MFMNPSFPDRLKGGSPVLAAWCGLPDPAVPALLAREAFDAVVLDLQHGAIDFASALRAVPLIAAAGKPADDAELSRVMSDLMGQAIEQIQAGR